MEIKIKLVETGDNCTGCVFDTGNNQCSFYNKNQACDKQGGWVWKQVEKDSDCE